MREALAERLLAQVMGWAPEDVAQERPDLQALATYKYDEYQQFSPGMRFVESLALWLSQFQTQRERQIAYQFVKSKLIFCSSAEMAHLVSIAYSDHIRPLLLRKAAHDCGIPEHLVAKISCCQAFKLRRRQCLFLGLSDGARIDIFRRYNHPELSHEQMLQTYEVSGKRVDELLANLSRDLAILLGQEASEDQEKFRTIVLLDDFSGSGISYLRRGQDGTVEGKIGKFYHSLTTASSEAARLVDIRRTEIVVVLYMGTEQAREHLQTLMKEVWEGVCAEQSLLVVHPFSEYVRIRSNDGSSVGELVEAYYDPTVEDEHTRRGGTDVKYGFAACGLPLVLSHNTPNNSLCLLWAEPESKTMRALFPRVSRHRKEA
jgi:hypothetical protein